MDGTAAADIGEVGLGHNVDDTPDKVGLLALHGDAELATDPRVATVTPDHVFGVDSLDLPGLATLGEAVHGVFFLGRRERRAEQAILDLVSKLYGGRFFLGQVTQLDGHGVGVGVVDFGLVELDRLGRQRTFDLDGAVGHLCNRVEKVPLNAALVQRALVEPPNAGDSVGDTVRTANDAIVVGVPQPDRGHVTRLTRKC